MIKEIGTHANTTKGGEPRGPSEVKFTCQNAAIPSPNTLAGTAVTNPAISTNKPRDAEGVGAHIHRRCSEEKHLGIMSNVLVYLLFATALYLLPPSGTK